MMVLSSHNQSQILALHVFLGFFPSSYSSIFSSEITEDKQVICQPVFMQLIVSALGIEVHLHNLCVNVSISNKKHSIVLELFCNL